MYVNEIVLSFIGGFVGGFMARSLQLAWAKWRYIKNLEKSFVATKSQAIANGEYEARKLHPEQAAAKKQSESP